MKQAKYAIFSLLFMVFCGLHPAVAWAAEGGAACAVLNGANEEAVALFLAGRIGFYDIPRLVAEARAGVPATREPSLADILEADRAAREIVRKEAERFS